MTDAFECDRCGALQGSPPALKVATNDIETLGSVNTETEGQSRTSLDIGLERQIGSPSKFTSWSIKQGDLCEDCAESLKAWLEEEGTDDD